MNNTSFRGKQRKSECSLYCFVNCMASYSCGTIALCLGLLIINVNNKLGLSQGIRELNNIIYVKSLAWCLALAKSGSVAIIIPCIKTSSASLRSKKKIFYLNASLYISKVHVNTSQVFHEESLTRLQFQGLKFLQPCYSRDRPRTSIISITWELIRNAHSQAPPQA